MFKKQGVCFPYIVFFFACMMFISFISCSLKKGSVDESSETSKQAAPSPLTYHKIILHNFEADERIAQLNPETATVCENSTLQELLDIGSAPMIIKTSPKTQRQADALIVKVRLVQIRSTIKARGKAVSPRTKLAAHVRLIDASDGKTLKEDNVFAANPPKKGASESPVELGAAVARYIDKFIRMR